MTNYTLIISNIKIHPEKDKESTNSRQYIWHNNSNGEPYEHSVSLCCWHDKIKDFPLNAVYYKTDKDVQGAWYWGKIFDKFFTGTHHTEYDYRDEKYPFPFEVYDMEEYGDHLVDRINTQKSNPYHKLELSVEIGSILKDRLAWVYYFGHEHYQLTGYQRDFLSGIDKLTLTSVEQNTL